MRKLFLVLALFLLAIPGFGTTWYAALPAGISCTLTNGSPTFTCVNTYVAGDVVTPAVTGDGFTAGTMYYVISTGLTVAHFEVSATYGGSALNSTGTTTLSMVGYSIDLLAWAVTSGGSCTSSGTTLTWGSQANGDVFDINGCSTIAITQDPGSASAEVTLQTNASNASTSYAYTLATALGLTIHTNVTCQLTPGNGALYVSGSTGSANIIGNITGSSSSGQACVDDVHTMVTVSVHGATTAGGIANAGGYLTHGASGTTAFYGNAFGGTGTSTIGINSGGSGQIVTLVGNATGGNGTSAYGVGNGGGSTSTFTMTGDCIGSDSFLGIPGCWNTSTGVFTVTGNLIWGLKSAPTGGFILYTPGPTNYILAPKTSLYVTGTVNTNATKTTTATGGGQHNTGYVQ